MIKQSIISTLICIPLLLAASLNAQSDLDKEAVIKQILFVEQQQREAVQSVVYEAEYIEGEEKDGQFKEKERINKKIYIKYLADTSLFYEEYLAYYKDGELQDDKKLQEITKERKEKKKKRKTMDISYSMVKPFYENRQDLYTIEYLGIANDSIDNFICHHFKVTANSEEPKLINGQYYFDAESFQLVRVDFSPAKLVKKTMFRMKELNMSIKYEPNDNNYWFPKQFDISGKGKAMFFIGVKIAGTEYYRNPQININIDDKFEVSDGN